MSDNGPPWDGYKAMQIEGQYIEGCINPKNWGCKEFSNVVLVQPIKYFEVVENVRNVQMTWNQFCWIFTSWN